MASNGYLRTVRVGGFDKQDVLAYVDDLTSKIYTLEAQVNDQNETIERLEKQGGAQKQDFEGKKELEKKVEEAKNKIAELMANTDTMKVRIADYEQQVTEKDAELEKQKQEIEDRVAKLTEEIKGLKRSSKLLRLMPAQPLLHSILEACSWKLRTQLIRSFRKLRRQLSRWKMKLSSFRIRFLLTQTHRHRSLLQMLRQRLILHFRQLSQALPQ